VRVTRLLRSDLTKQLKTLDVKEDNLLDLAATDALAKDKIQQRLRTSNASGPGLTNSWRGSSMIFRNRSAFSICACSSSRIRTASTSAPATKPAAGSIKRSSATCSSTARRSPMPPGPPQRTQAHQRKSRRNIARRLHSARERPIPRCSRSR
jgi:hypothetical protein